MVAVYLSPVYIIVNILLAWRLIVWMGDVHPKMKNKRIVVAVAVLYGFVAVSLLVGFLLPEGYWKKQITLLSDYWLGILMYMVIFVIIVTLFHIIVYNVKAFKPEFWKKRIMKAVTGGVGIAAIISVSFYGFVNAKIVRTTTYNVSVEKECGENSSIKICLVADLHLGYNIGYEQMKRMVDKINAMDADVVVIAGDIFDNDYDSIDNPEKIIDVLKTIKTQYGVYATYGNHDIAEKILAGFTFSISEGKKMSDIRMDEFLENANIKLLRDEAVLIDNSFYIYGRPDKERLGRGIDERKEGNEVTEGLDKTKPIIVVDHEPNDIDAMAGAGADLYLCGHTHDGQVFPGNILTDIMWENSYGYMEKGNMHNIVTSGVGLFGPNMRVGTIAEVCEINVEFK